MVIKATRQINVFFPSQIISVKSFKFVFAKQNKSKITLESDYYRSKGEMRNLK